MLLPQPQQPQQPRPQQQQPQQLSRRVSMHPARRPRRLVVALYQRRGLRCARSGSTPPHPSTRHAATRGRTRSHPPSVRLHVRTLPSTHSCSRRSHSGREAGPERMKTPPGEPRHQRPKTRGRRSSCSARCVASTIFVRVACSPDSSIQGMPPASAVLMFGAPAKLLRRCLMCGVAEWGRRSLTWPHEAPHRCLWR